MSQSNSRFIDFFRGPLGIVTAIAFALLGLPLIASTGNLLLGALSTTNSAVTQNSSVKDTMHLVRAVPLTNEDEVNEVGRSTSMQFADGNTDVSTNTSGLAENNSESLLGESVETSTRRSPDPRGPHGVLRSLLVVGSTSAAGDDYRRCSAINHRTTLKTKTRCR